MERNDAEHALKRACRQLTTCRRRIGSNARHAVAHRSAARATPMTQEQNPLDMLVSSAVAMVESTTGRVIDAPAPSSLPGPWPGELHISQSYISRGI